MCVGILGSCDAVGCPDSMRCHVAVAKCEAAVPWFECCCVTLRSCSQLLLRVLRVTKFSYISVFIWLDSKSQRKTYAEGSVKIKVCLSIQKGKGGEEAVRLEVSASCGKPLPILFVVRK